MTTPDRSPLLPPGFNFDAGEYLNAVDHGVLFVDPEGLLGYYNPFCRELFSLDLPSPHSVNYFNLLTEWSDQQGLSKLWLVELGNAIRQKQRHYTRVNHDDNVLEFKHQPLPSGGFVHCIYNITNKVKQEQDSAHKYKQLRTMIDAMPCFVSLLNTNLQFMIANRYLKEHLGICRPDIEGSYIRAVLPKALRSKHLNLLHRALQGETIHFDECTSSRRAVIRSVHGSYVPCFDQYHNVTAIVNITYDTTEQKTHEEKLRVLAERDHLTRLFNRRKIMDCLETEILRADRQASALTIAIIDLDHFKNVNDKWGHPAGDLVLKEFALLCQQQIRKIDCLGRIGGEEFLLIMSDTDQTEARCVLERILSVVRHHPFNWKQTEINITCSAGLAECRPLQNIQQLCAQADKALYQAKNNGRNQIVIVTE